MFTRIRSIPKRSACNTKKLHTRKIVYLGLWYKHIITCIIIFYLGYQPGYLYTGKSNLGLRLRTYVANIVLVYLIKYLVRFRRYNN